MKKLVKLLAAVFMGMSLCGCSNSDKDSEPSQTTVNSAAGKYLPYGADIGDLHMSYEDMVEADMVNNVYIVIDKDGKNGKAALGEGDAEPFVLSDGKMTFRTDGTVLPYEIDKDGIFRLSLGDEETEFFMLFAKEGEAFEKAKAETSTETSLPPEESNEPSETDMQSGDGICDIETLKNGYNEIHVGDLQANGYEDVVNVFGVGGEELNSSFFQWTDTERFYTWHDADKDVIVTATFQKDAEGIWHLQSMSVSGPNDIIKDFKS